MGSVKVTMRLAGEGEQPILQGREGEKLEVLHKGSQKARHDKE